MCCVTETADLLETLSLDSQTKSLDVHGSQNKVVSFTMHVVTVIFFIPSSLLNDDLLCSLAH